MKNTSMLHKRFKYFVEENCYMFSGAIERDKSYEMSYLDFF